MYAWSIQNIQYEAWLPRRLRSRKITCFQSRLAGITVTTNHGNLVMQNIWYPKILLLDCKQGIASDREGRITPQTAKSQCLCSNKGYGMVVQPYQMLEAKEHMHHACEATKYIKLNSLLKQTSIDTIQKKSSTSIIMCKSKGETKVTI